MNKIYFRCNLPDQENKLTLKMQTFSPSPFGFEFDYCTDYYYIGYYTLFDRNIFKSLDDLVNYINGILVYSVFNSFVKLS